MVKPILSKTQFLKGWQCPLALWYYLKRKDLRPEIDIETEERFETGNQVGDLAKEYFGSGVEVTNKFWDILGGETTTKKFIDQGHNLIFEATAIDTKTGKYSRIDVLKKNPGTNDWDLIEVKSSTSVKDYHYLDLSFQYNVFKSAGYNIRKACLLIINNQYVRKGNLCLEDFFRIEDLTEEILLKQNLITKKTEELLKVLNGPGDPKAEIGIHCFEPFECDFRHHCWKHVPEYSTFNILTKKKAFEVAKVTGSFEIKDLPKDYYPSGKKIIDIHSHLMGGEHIDLGEIKLFLEKLKFPLYFLDYETIGPAMPLFEGCRPYQQIPFQFSLHIQEELGGELQHHDFLHWERNDPRIPLVENLVELCGSRGSVIVYNQSFEEGCNKALASFLPSYETHLKAINTRMVDLLTPFKSRALYHPSQNGSASLKYVLPAHTPLRYHDLEIQGGGEASVLYYRFITERLSEIDEQKLKEKLLKYCHLDTFAMVELLKVLGKKVTYS